jgi:N-acetyl-beta-hexosaminidase
MTACFAERLGLPARAGERNVALAHRDGLADEAYRRVLGADGVTVSAPMRNGFLHSLTTLCELRDGPFLPLGAVDDYPRLRTLRIHLMYECFRRLGYRETVRLLDSAARLKLNTVLLEFGDRFPLPRALPGQGPAGPRRPELLRQSLHVVIAAPLPPP